MMAEKFRDRELVERFFWGGMTSRIRENPCNPAHQRKEECPLAH